MLHRNCPVRQAKVSHLTIDVDVTLRLNLLPWHGVPTHNSLPLTMPGVPTHNGLDPVFDFQNPSPLALLSYKGDLTISLKFVTPEMTGGKKRGGKGQLHVLVKQARNLTAVRSNGFSDPFCKGCVRCNFF